MLHNRFIGGPPFGVRLFWQTQSTTNQRKDLFFEKVILDKSEFE